MHVGEQIIIGTAVAVCTHAHTHTHTTTVLVGKIYFLNQGLQNRTGPVRPWTPLISLIFL